MKLTAKDLIELFKKRKRLCVSVLLILLGVVLIALSSVNTGGDSEEKISLSEYKKSLETELEELCSSVRGVGKCKVMVTFERGEENTYKGSSLIETKPPRVLGVSIVCKGADSDSVRAELFEMVGALFDIGSNRISILKLNS